MGASSPARASSALRAIPPIAMYSSLTIFPKAERRVTSRGFIFTLTPGSQNQIAGLAFELEGLHYEARKSVAEHVRLICLLFAMPGHHQRPFKFTHGAMRMQPVE